MHVEGRSLIANTGERRRTLAVINEDGVSIDDSGNAWIDLGEQASPPWRPPARGSFSATERPMPMFHRGNRDLQERFASRALADRLVERLHRSAFTEEDQAFIESVEFFFVATADAEGRPDCSFKGGAAGFVRVVHPGLLVWPDYDGNGMFKSLGNVLVNPHVGLLFIRVGEAPKRLRVNGTAEVSLDDPLIGEFEGAQAIVRFTPVDIFPNCPRYVPDLAGGKPSRFIPRANEARVEPGWKDSPAWKELVPPRKA